MPEISVIIPNYNGIKYLAVVLESLERQKFRDFETIIVDNGSTDGSTAFVRENYPSVILVELHENTGFAPAANAGIKRSRSPYVLLLNNDTEADENMLSELLHAAVRHPDAFSCCARMISFTDRTRLDNAGDYYTALGWAVARGKGKAADRYMKEEKVFSCCAAASLYRKDFLEKTGLFDEAHFAYLEDVDLGYRARIRGYENWYIPSAVLWHVGSGTSGSRHNPFKVRLSARNNVYMIYKNMPPAQILLNLPFLTAGFGIKAVYFMRRGMGKDYLQGLKEGIKLCRPEAKTRFGPGNIRSCIQIQLELWLNLFRVPF